MDDQSGGGIMPYVWTTGETITAAKLNPQVINLQAASAANTWTARASLGFAVSRLAGAALSGYVYAIGGNSAVSSEENRVSRYDPVANSWVGVANVLTGRRDSAAAALSGYIYLFGGDDGVAPFLAATERYDPIANSWSSAASLGTARVSHGGASANGYVYAFGGRGAASVVFSSVEEYDAASNTWTSKTSMANPRYGFGDAEHAGYIYAAGGRIGATVSVATITATLEQYDPVANSWSAKASQAVAKEIQAAASLGSFLYAFGGFTASALSGTTERYSPSLNT
jgi:N-acetylneuraminic acid mutarotase